MLLLCTAMLTTSPLRAQEEPSVPAPTSPIPLERVEVQVIEFEGNIALSDEVLRDVVPVTPGTVINPTLLTEAIRAIERAYAERGYVAEVTQIRVIGDQPPRTLVFDIRETVVVEIVIQGLRRTRESAIRRLLDMKPGDLFNRRVLQEDVNRLDELGIFERIEVTLEPGDELGEEIVLYNVQERKTGEITIGGSFSPSDELVAEATFTQANLFGRAQRLAASLAVGTVRGDISGELSYYNPFIASPRTDLLVRAFDLKQYRFTSDLVDEPGSQRYSERHIGLQAVAGRRLDDFSRAAVGLRYENIDPTGLPVQFFTDPDLGTSGSVVLGTARYTSDRRLYLLIPSAGNYFTSFLEAGSAERGDGTGLITKLTVQRNWYVPLQTITPEMLTADPIRPIRSLAVRLSVGAALGNLPFFEQFFLGGVYNLRGYRESRFWGQYYALLNVEYRVPFSRQLIGAAFIDAGDAWGSDFQFTPGTDTAFTQHESFSPRIGVGVGVLWVTTFGALRLDVARGEDTRVHFAFGEIF